MEAVDTIIIGAGPAGLTAALYLARYEKKTLVLTEDIGGQAATSGEVANYPAFELISGSELTQKMLEQVKKYPTVEVRFPAEVKSVEKKGDLFEVSTKEKVYQAKTVLITAGKRHRTLGVPDEEKLVGKGLSYCATCDGPFAKGRKTVIIGGGNSAADAALILAKIAKQITVLNLTDKMKAETVRLNRIRMGKNTRIINNAKATKIDTQNGKIASVVYEDKSGKEQLIETEMVFVEIGYMPNTEIFSDMVELNENKEIVVKADCSTKTEGLYAAGDITDTPHKQVIIACGEGAKAAMSINKALEK